MKTIEQAGYKIGDTVLINTYNDKGRLPAQQPKGTITGLPKSGNKLFEVTQNSNKKVFFLGKNEFTLAGNIEQAVTKRLKTVSELTPKQKQLDIDEDGKIDGEDLKAVRKGALATDLQSVSVEADDAETNSTGLKLSAKAIKVADTLSLKMGFEDTSMAHHMSVGLMAYVFSDPRYQHREGYTPQKFMQVLKRNAPKLKLLLAKIEQETMAG